MNNVTTKVKSWRDDFPIFQQQVRGKTLTYLDSGATTQKPQNVIDSIHEYYRTLNANVHRGVYLLSQKATDSFNQARHTVKQFLSAKHDHEIIFTRSTTEAINLVAHGFARKFLKEGDEVIVSCMEHHSNIAPWQVAREETGAILKVIPVLEDGTLDLITYKKLLNKKTRVVAITHVSNVLGTINPIRNIIEWAHEYDAAVLIDGAQAVTHFPVDVQELNCDFYTFSGHKLYGPTGIGVLYGKSEWLDKLPPYQTGGSMIRRVSFEKTEYQELPYKFEAGTQNIAGVIGLKTAIDYLKDIGFAAIHRHENQLTQQTLELLSQIEGLTVIGTAPQRVGIISFVMRQAHPHDIGTLLDQEGIAIRAGHHCAMPLMERFNLPATARVSFGIYNDLPDIYLLVDALKKVIKLFGN